MRQRESKPRKWFTIFIILLVSIILGMFIIVWIFDPYFHFHKPFSFVSYRLNDERYINDGISRYFDYDAIITGTSMSQNFKTTEVDKLFGVNSVKESFAGAGYKELSQNLDRALSRHGADTVIWVLDFNGIMRDKDYQAYEDYPEYLYDDDLFNDISYVFNKEVWYHGVFTNIAMTLSGKDSTTFDEYSAWDKETGYEYVMSGYDRWEEKGEMHEGLDEERREMVTGNIKQNIVDMVSKYPDTTFYIYYTPYSIVWWDFMNQEGMMKWQFEAELIATQLMLECPNVKLYNFNDKYDIITNLDNYRDKEHYSAQINSKILEWMVNGDGLVTKDNYLERLEIEKDYYLNYDYESIFH